MRPTDNNVDKARALITLSADVNSKNRYRHPILSFAAHKGNPEVVELTGVQCIGA